MIATVGMVWVFSYAPKPQVLVNVPAGLTTLTWLPLKNHDSPSPNPTSQTLPSGTSVTFTGTYTYRPERGIGSSWILW